MLEPVAEMPFRDKLSSHESAVLELLSSGLTNMQIAARLGISISAVKFHLGSIYRKLEVRNRTEATSVYLRAAVDAIRAAPEA